MKENGTLGFWEPGFSILSDELDREEARRTNDLRRMLKTATTPEKKGQIRKMIAETGAEFRERRRAAEASLFLRQ